MTTNVKVTTNGNYVAMVKVNGKDEGTVGPGNSVSRDFSLRHDKHPNTFEVDEREATADEIAASKSKV